MTALGLLLLIGIGIVLVLLGVTRIERDEPGRYDVILDADGEPIGVVETTRHEEER